MLLLTQRAFFFERFNRSFLSFDHNFEFIVGERIFMFLNIMLFELVNRMKTVVALRAKPLSPVYLPLVGEPLMTSFEEVSRMMAVLKCTDIRPAIFKNMFLLGLLCQHLERSNHLKILLQCDLLPGYTVFRFHDAKAIRALKRIITESSWRIGNSEIFRLDIIRG
jgi:hypothetical protein